jgi:hypothetical protein
MDTLAAADVAKKIVEKYKGKKWRTSDEAADWFQYGESVAIRFISSAVKLRNFLIEEYSDYLIELKWCAYGDEHEVKWLRKDIVPIAVIADVGSEADNEEFIEEATGFLFCDGEKEGFCLRQLG